MSSLYRWLVTAFIAFGAGAVFSASVPYFADFEEGIGPEWSEALWDSSQPYHFTAFSGRFGTTNQVLTLSDFEVGETYTVGFDLYVIDAWNNAQSVRVVIDEDILFDESFANSGTQTNPRQPDEGRDHLGFNSGNHDTIYRHLQVTFTAATATVEIEFHGINVGDIAARSWGARQCQRHPR